MEDNIGKSKEFHRILSKLNDLLKPFGFECGPFKVDWYNEIVHDAFRLHYPVDTLVFVIISTPSMFEKAFKPFIEEAKVTGIRDPIDQCVSHHIQQAREAFPLHDVDIMLDYELDNKRKPKILVQTAAHAAGAAYYYQRKDVKNDPWPKTKKLFGVCIHPKFGGWFAMRGVMIFKDFSYPGLQKRAPPDVLKTDKEKIDLLERFTFNWQDWSESGFRDIIPVEEKYSDEQIKYFDMPPKDRFKLLGLECDDNVGDDFLSGHG